MYKEILQINGALAVQGGVLSYSVSLAICVCGGLAIQEGCCDARKGLAMPRGLAIYGGGSCNSTWLFLCLEGSCRAVGALAICGRPAIQGGLL